MSVEIDSERLALAERLRERRRELQARLDEIRANRKRERAPADPEPAQEAAEVLEQLDASERYELDEIDRALQRVDAGCFGICDECGQDIDPERLSASPAAALCVLCAAVRDRRAVT